MSATATSSLVAELAGRNKFVPLLQTFNLDLGISNVEVGPLQQVINQSLHSPNWPKLEKTSLM